MIHHYHILATKKKTVFYHFEQQQQHESGYSTPSNRNRRIIREIIVWNRRKNEQFSPKKQNWSNWKVVGDENRIFNATKKDFYEIRRQRHCSRSKCESVISCSALLGGIKCLWWIIFLKLFYFVKKWQNRSVLSLNSKTFYQGNQCSAFFNVSSTSSLT